MVVFLFAEEFVDDALLLVVILLTRVVPQS